MPYVDVTVELVSSVPGHVQELTMPAVMSPGLTLREAVANSSTACEEYEVNGFGRSSITSAKKIPMTTMMP
jgi:hypothetical protein